MGRLYPISITSEAENHRADGIRKEGGPDKGEVKIMRTPRNHTDSK